MQLVNFKQWEDLCNYLQDPQRRNRHKLVSIPAFHKALGDKDCDIDALNSVLRWVESRARSVLSDLLGQAKDPLPLADSATLPSEKSWMKVRFPYTRLMIPLSNSSV